MPDLKDYPSGNVTFVFTDIEESSKTTLRLERRHGLGYYQKNLQEPHRVRLKAEADGRRGIEVQRAGDGHMFVFQKAADALACVVAFQRSLRADPILHGEGEEPWTLRVRVGVHTAERQRDPVPLENGLVEYPGSDTNFASRVAGLGRGGQILISETSATEARGLEGCRLHPWPNRLLKSFEDRAHTIHEVLYEPGQEPLEPGMQWLPDWYRAENKLYIARPDLERLVVDHFQRKAGPSADPTRWRPGGQDGPRIVSLKAEGGMGKTRLAIQCAAQVADLFEDGVYLVPLATVLPGEEAVAEAIGRALGLPARDSRPGAVLEYLKGRAVLLVLDNYEAVEDPDQKACRYLIRLVGEAHGLRLLVTGRSTVNVVDVEQVIDLNDGMATAEARALFLDRARLRWKPDRKLTASEEVQLDRILDLTTNIPLAVELAAAWVGYRELQEIADGLAATPLGPETGVPPRSRRFDADTAHGRHDSLTRSLDWSYDLLGKTGGQSAQALFATCGLFAAPFDASTVATVAGVSDAREDLDRLLDASLIRREAVDGATRHRLHRFTREYALRRLDEAPTADETRRRYIAHYVRLVEENAPDPNELGRYAVLDKEWRNALAAFPVAETLQDPSSLVPMTALGVFFRFRGLWSEPEFLVLQILAIVRSANDKQNEGVILNSLGINYEAQNRYDEALDAYAQALAIFREFHDRLGEGRTLSNMGLVYQNQGRYAEALDTYAQALTIRREFHDRVGEGQTLNNIGIVYSVQGRYAEAIDAYAQALAIFREFHDRLGEGRTLSNMGLVYQNQGRYAEALDAYAQALTIRREFHDRVGEGQTLNNMGIVHEVQGRYAEALDAYAQALAIERKFRVRVDEGQTLENLALLSATQHKLPDAIRWARQAVAVLETTEATAALAKARRTLDGLEKDAADEDGTEAG